MLNRNGLIILTVITILIFVTVPAAACEFYFNYEKIEAELGVTGSLAIRVYKTHNDCTLSGMDEYKFTGENVQIIEKSPWEEIDNNLYEIHFKLVLSEIGPGYFRIFKDCSKEGYDQKELPIIVREGGELWHTAFYEQYPHEIENTGKLEGDFEIDENLIHIDGESMELPETPAEFESYQDKLVLYYTEIENEKTPLLLVGENIYYRYEHYWQF